MKENLNQTKSVEKISAYKLKKEKDKLFEDVKPANLNNVTDKKDGKISGNYRLRVGMHRTPHPSKKVP